jgi:hypothetical protein
MRRFFSIIGCILLGAVLAGAHFVLFEQLTSEGVVARTRWSPISGRSTGTNAWAGLVLLFLDAVGVAWVVSQLRGWARRRRRRAHG